MNPKQIQACKDFLITLITKAQEIKNVPIEPTTLKIDDLDDGRNGLVELYETLTQAQATCSESTRNFLESNNTDDLLLTTAVKNICSQLTIYTFILNNYETLKTKFGINNVEMLDHIIQSHLVLSVPKNFGMILTKLQFPNLKPDNIYSQTMKEDPLKSSEFSNAIAQLAETRAAQQQFPLSLLDDENDDDEENLQDAPDSSGYNAQQSPISFLQSKRTKSGNYRLVANNGTDEDDGVDMDIDFDKKENPGCCASFSCGR